MGTTKGTTKGTAHEQQSTAIRTFTKSTKIRAHRGHKYKERRKKENTPDGVSKKDKLSSPSPSEKIDYPELDTIVMARPTMSLALWYQIVGRAIFSNGRQLTNVRF